MKINKSVLRRSWLGLTTLGLVLLVGLAVRPQQVTKADGTANAVLGVQYGSTRMQDLDTDGVCVGTDGGAQGVRGDILDSGAYSHTTGEWFFYTVTDTIEALNTQYSGNDGNTPAYMFLIDTGSRNATAKDFSTLTSGSGTNVEAATDQKAWHKNFKAKADYWVGCKATGADTLSCALFNASTNTAIGAAWTETTQKVGTRRFIEVHIPAASSGSIPGLTDNSPIYVNAATVYSFDNGAFLDSSNSWTAADSCTAAKDLSDYQILTASNCKASGAPTDAGVNDRQCSSNPIGLGTQLPAAASCVQTQGIYVDGIVDGSYTELNEVSHAAPYKGGNPIGADLAGESSAAQYFNSGLTMLNLYTTSAANGKDGAADLEKVYVHMDSKFLYVIVKGKAWSATSNSLNAFGGSITSSNGTGGVSGSAIGQPTDLANMYIAIETGAGGTGSTDTTDTAEAATAPSSRRVNFAGWQPNYVVEMIWAGNDTGTGAAKLYSGASWGTSADFTTKDDAATAVTHSGTVDGDSTDLYFGRETGSFEFAIPWAAIGGNPGTTDDIKFGIYTTADSNTDSANNWDTFDQAPGIGQGCSAAACHERLGDDPTDGDSEAQNGSEGDKSPYSGDTNGGTNYEPGSDVSTIDVDTIKSYFSVYGAPNKVNCNPTTLGAIGNYVWIDENGDGRQDIGEPGIPNVTVNLYAGDGTTVLGTTITDSNGGYLFPSLAAGSYVVKLDSTTIPTGLVRTTNPVLAGQDFGNQGLPYNINLGAGEENMTADFGYNYNPSSEVIGNGSTYGAIGDRVWRDTNGDGAQNAGEPGIGGVVVRLDYDMNNDGDFTDPGEMGYLTTVTAPDGSYMFNGLDLGAYRVAIPTPPAGANTGDPNGSSDSIGGTVTLTAAAPINRDQDFGYDDNVGTFYELGSTVWRDSDEDGAGRNDGGNTAAPAQPDGTFDNAEVGIVGATLSLYIDTNNNKQVDLSDELIATTMTGANGHYLFTGLLPNNYLVVVTDTGNVINGEQTYDADDGNTPTATGTGARLPQTPNTSAVTISNASVYTQDFGYNATVPANNGFIGDTVFFDANNNSTFDAGEGVPGVIVELRDSTGKLVAVTSTDSAGKYLFDNLATAQTYSVMVVAGSSPILAGTENHVTPGSTVGDSVGDLVNPDNLLQDFGYRKFNPATLGDRVWADADSDGIQDPNEPGISNVMLQLIVAGNDGVFGTADDVVVATDTTDSNGNYLFDNLPAGAYVVNIPTPPSGTTQTGDPDHFATTGTNDNKTTTPVVLAPGDVFLNVDFGYVPTTVLKLGDTIFFEGVPNGTKDGADYGIPNVTVALFIDTDGDGNLDVGEKIVATDVTDASGMYLFEGLTSGTNYGVRVTDTNNVLDGLKQSSTPNNGVNNGQACGTCDGDNGVTALAADNLNQDFGYTPKSHNATNPGVIGDEIFLDTNSDGNKDAGEPGLEGIKVELILDVLKDGVTVSDEVRTTYTDENGYYYFADLPAPVAGADYYVRVTTPTGTTQTSWPGGAGGVGNGTEDGVPGTGLVSPKIILDNTNTANLKQDFGFSGPNSVGNLVWLDADADGVKDASEVGIDGVTLEIYRDTDGDGGIDVNEPLYGTTTTASGGAYNFGGLPDGKYVVKVTDSAGVLNGYWHSYGDQAVGTDNSSKNDPYAVDLDSAGSNGSAVNITTVDFGYYKLPAAVGNRVWIDTNRDGTQDSGELPVVGAYVTLTITYPNGAVTILTTMTDASGNYTFGNLLTDESQNGDSANNGSSYNAPTGEPSFTISVADPIGYKRTLVDVGAATDKGDSDEHGGVTAIPVKGMDTFTTTNATPTSEPTIASYDFGYYVPVTLGNRVWNDSDNDGQMDINEVGIAGVTVKLYRDDGDNVHETTDALVATVVTDGSGYYNFPDINIGADTVTTKYFVAVVQPVGFSASSGPNIGNHTDPAVGDETTNIKGDDGIPMTGLGVISQMFQIQLNNAPTTTDAGDPPLYTDANSYMTLDFGFNSSPTAVELTSLNSVTPTNMVTFAALALAGLAVLTSSVVFVVRRRKVQG